MTTSLRVVLVVLCVVGVAAQWYPRASDLDAFLGEGEGFTANFQPSGDTLYHLKQKVMTRLQNWATAELAKHGRTAADNAEPYPYFHWIPPYKASARPDGPAVSWAGACFQNTTAKVKTNANGTLEITITRAKQKALFCSDFYLIGTASGIMIQDFTTEGTSTLLWVPHNDSTPGETWDIKTKGIRFMLFVDDLPGTIANALATVNLFLGDFLPKLTPEGIAINLDFMAKYANRKMNPRATPEVSIDPSLVQSGDFFGIIRLGGLDPMLAWAMGSTTGHTTVALRMDGVLYITESTTKDAYWPTNGIQKTEYSVWMKQAKAADYQVVWAPLSASVRAKFNESAAIAKFKELEGLDYGYHNMLWAWIDTIKDNYPCLPPNWNQCLQWEHVEMLFNWMDRLAPPVGELLVDEAMNKRVGTVGLRIADVWQIANSKGIDARTVPSVVEQDSWDYKTLKNGQPVVGKSMVCCVYVCNVWKAAGVFKGINDNFNCGEMTNFDDYSLSIFDTGPRPAVCQSADPSNVNCQLEGAYSLELPGYNSVQPYQHMRETCPSLAPDYKKPAGC